jgi:hypothetical protein
MLPYLQAIRHVAVVTPIKNPNQVEQRHHGKDHPSHQRKRFFVHQRSSQVQDRTSQGIANRPADEAA